MAKACEAGRAEEGYQDIIDGVERRPFPTLEGLRNNQRPMKLRNPAIEKMKLDEIIDDRILSQDP